MKQEPHLHNAALCSPGAKQDLPPEHPDTTRSFTPKDSLHHVSIQTPPGASHPRTGLHVSIQTPPGASHPRTAFIT